jgi:hypothetical protein
MSTEIITVTDVETLDGHRILVTFSDGAIKEIDMSTELAAARGVFVALRDPRVFASVRVTDSGTIEWPGEVDLDPEVLYGVYEPASGPPMRRRTVREPTPPRR